MTSTVLKVADGVVVPGAARAAVDWSQVDEERVYLLRCARGDEAAIRWIIGQYRERVVRLAAHVLRSPREAEDVAQEAFIRAFKQINQFRWKSAFYAWLYRIVINICLDRMRRKCMTAEVPIDEDAMSRSAVAPDMDKRLAIEQVLNTLSAPLRACLMLREVGGLEYVEIAQVMHCPVGTVRSRLNAAREQFRRRWIEMNAEAENV